MGFYLLFLKRGGTMKREERHDIMKQDTISRSQVEELGKQLGLSTEQIHAILNDTQPSTEYPSVSVGPPRYGAGFYGTVSIRDIDTSKNTK
jgi:hypothetical protein